MFFSTDSSLSEQAEHGARGTIVTHGLPVLPHLQGKASVALYVSCAFQHAQVCNSPLIAFR